MAGGKNYNRREFLRGSFNAAASVVAFPYIVSSSALGKEGSVVPSDRIVMGCIGLGGQGTQNMNAFLRQEGVELAALCDVNKGSDDYDMLYQFKDSSSAGLEPAKQRALAYLATQKRSGSYEGIDCYHDFRDLLARNDIDAVSICTPDHWHGGVSIAAAKAGKDIYCEKPLTNTIAEGRAVCDAVEKYQRVLQTGSHERSNNSTRFAAELVLNGRIGKLHTIRINMPVDNQIAISAQPVMKVPDGFDYDFWLGPTEYKPYTRRRCHFYWRYQLAYGGGEMTDRGAHIIDLAQMANDTDDTGPVEILAKGQAPADGLFDTFDKFEFECKYANGVRMVGQHSGVRGLKLEGDKGWIFIHIHGGRLEAEPASLLTEYIGPNERHLGRSPDHHRNFLDCVKTRQKPFACAEIGHRTGTICHLLNIAMLTNRKLKWDPHTEQIINDDAANSMVRRTMRSPWNFV
ncbi:MAG TPA: Gfo/Idh/MocA family oxidoreductase [Sedimentisphaerales bacterium]|nr:Gfo/Idh/MocA family oxidoreductase [Sedimentisphaerales bacterium]